jgi:hypothetical protein
MAWEILERNLPQYDFVERHQRLIKAPPPDVWQAVQTARVAGSLLTRSAVALRMLPARLAGRAAPEPAPLYDLSGMKNFLRLGETSNRELVLGMVGQFWRPRGGLRPIEPEAFADFAEADFAKLAWGFDLEPSGPGTRLRTETRIRCLSADSRRRLRPYWMIIRPISGLIRREILAGIGDVAEMRDAAKP